ncbi:Stk1 family PASTA domain-containing Ser/Thr kinase [Actinospongicola halichondriae]|uniref:Stk1 family PASTA domain-containing Ser/Thr kinase n=1 Tax=Actinospongicola halichondriae TaxID=3236844 RepID=UPI003D55B593
MSDQGPVVYGGRYELHSRLARGGMADVYLARDQLLDRPVAVKVLFAQYASDPAFVERFRREAQAAANLNHPNVVGVYDWGEESGTYYIVMEYVDGRSLADVLRQEGTLLPTRAADIGIDMAAALGFAHRNGVVHRDVKPGNVMLASDGQVKVTDFGIARAVSAGSDQNLTQTGLVMGTATYFSPEQAQGKPVDPRSDVYSLGIVLYESVCGRPPFRGDDALAVAYQHVQEPPTPPRQINAAIEPTLEAIILKCIAKNPSARYPSAEDLRADLRRYREGNQIAADTAIVAPAAAVAATQAVPITTMQDTSFEQPYEPAYDPHYGYDDYAEPPRRNGAFIAIMILLLLVLGGVLFFLAQALGVLDGNESTDANLVTVPNVVGRQLEGPDGARIILEGAGFVIDTKFEDNPDFEDGEVISQSPEGNADLEEGGTVELTVSNGEPVVTLHDVVGFTEQDARSDLGDQGFRTINTELIFSGDVEPGKVVEQDPAAGEDVPLSAEITLRVSQGADTRVVPDVAGRPVDEAEGILTQAEFNVAQQQENSPSVPAGTVIRTDPPANTSLEKGSTVTLFVSVGPEQVIVPDVTEKTEDTARTELETAGFTVNVEDVTLVPGDPDDGRVISQDPAGSTRAEKGSTVTIRVGRATPVPDP